MKLWQRLVARLRPSDTQSDLEEYRQIEGHEAFTRELRVLRK